jgi:hypothetical protein
LPSEGNKTLSVNLNDASVSEIIDRVGLPLKTNFANLRKDLDFAKTWFAVQRKISQGNDLPKKLDAVKRAIQKLSNALDDDGVKFALRFSIVTEILGNLDTLASHIALITDIQIKDGEMSQEELEVNSRLASELNIGTASSFEWLAGKHLAVIFERHFRREARISRNPDTGHVNGPYIRFVEAVLNKLDIQKGGKPYAPESIAKARANERAGRVRRKGSRSARGK